MDLSISEMMQMQRELYAIHKDSWSPREPEFGKDHILFMIEEIGETISILKKKGNSEIMQNEQVRSAFLEELSDILMYYMDVLLCYHISAEEIAQAYHSKHIHNLSRNYTREYKEKYNG